MRSTLLFAVLVLALSACGDARRFTPESWRQADPLDRHVFVGDLVSRRVLIGKTRREVIEALGAGQQYGSVMVWNVGVDDKGKAEVLQVDFANDVAVQAKLQHR